MTDRRLHLRRFPTARATLAPWVWDLALEKLRRTAGKGWAVARVGFVARGEDRGAA